MKKVFEFDNMYHFNVGDEIQEFIEDKLVEDVDNEFYGKSKNIKNAKIIVEIILEE